MVACSQPAASEIGLRILQSGGNAVDAAVAIGAALNLTEGMSTGLGGDCFILFKPAGDPKVYALNGSGRAAASLTSAQVRADCAKTYGIKDPDSIVEFPGDRSAARKCEHRGQYPCNTSEQTPEGLRSRRSARQLSTRTLTCKRYGRCNGAGLL
jgi:hypothetical protein